MSEYQWKPLQDEKKFEKLVNDLLSKQYPNAQLYGRRGQAQGGIDGYSLTQDQKLIVYQCKNKLIHNTDEKKIVADLLKDLAKECEKTYQEFIEKKGNVIETYIFAHSFKRDTNLQDKAIELSQTYPFTIVIWSWDEIATMLEQYRDVANKYYPDAPRDIRNLTALPAQNPQFVGRVAEMEKIKEAFEGNNVVCVVNGIGGVGKSELIQHYLHAHQQEYQHTAFIELASGQSIRSALESNTLLHETLKLEEKTWDHIVHALQLLPSPNLIVIDNLTQEGDYPLIQPLNSNFKLLISTRQALGDTNISLGTLTREDARTLFLSICKDKCTDDHTLGFLLDHLDDHPLFIRLIASSLTRATQTLAKLSSKIQHQELASLKCTDQRAKTQAFNEHLRELFDTQFQTHEEVGRFFLQCLSLFPSIAIPLSIFEAIFGEMPDFEEAFDTLVESGWLMRQGDRYKLHQIIQEFLRNVHPLDTTITQAIITKTLTLISQEHAHTQGDYIPILESFLRLSNRKEIHGLLHNQIARLFNALGHYPLALDHYQKALKIAKEVLDPDHPDTVASYNNLAMLYTSMGRYEEALSLYQKALEIRQKVHGLDHPDTAQGYNNLASLYQSMGAYETALSLYQKSFVIRKKFLGPDHPDTAQAYNNLASLYCSMGRYKEALPLHHKALEIAEKVFGPDHPNTAASYDNLAALYQSMEMYAEALPLHQKALEIWEKVLALDHPDTAISYNNLALLYMSMGKYAEALPLHQKALVINEKIYGLDHSKTATSHWNLGMLYKAMKQCHQALEHLQYVQAIAQKIEHLPFSRFKLEQAIQSVRHAIKQEAKAKPKNQGKYCVDRP